MYDFDSNNKVPGIYWLKQPIDDLKIKITIKPQTTAINLPKYEEFMNISTTADLEKIDNNKNEEYIFKWQEKVFSTWEINNYSEIHNCITETQLDHHNTLNSIVYKPQKVFTYIHKDYYLPLPLDLKKTQYQTDNFNLLLCFENLNLDGRFSGSFGGTSSMRQLYRSEDSMIEKSSWIAMHVVFDNSKYTDNSIRTELKNKLN
ncbi:hypothetical protein RR48_05411 [Papilio machaon]|uniref:Uncharacterized protein n=1 Tax=Papilio machaon TaxID=76193 RepID=A0A0N1IFL9_PAPMA|nr:hypothetical protein RR48_05411 [Papilio machaon]